jgi:predicted enzyme related to lactoylglutathione lyase
MNAGFVWFQNNSEKVSDSASFYQRLLGWTPVEGPPGMTLLGADERPFAGIGPSNDDLVGWIPYAEVDDVETATERAVKLGAQVLKKKTRGPAGEFSIVRDPGGAAVALWQRA